MVERCALSGSDLKIKFRTILLTSIPNCRAIHRFSNLQAERDCILKKNQSTSRPSEHPPVMEEKMSKRLGGIKGCKYKTSSWHLNRFPDADNIGSTV